MAPLLTGYLKAARKLKLSGLWRRVLERYLSVPLVFSLLGLLTAWTTGHLWLAGITLAGFCAQFFLTQKQINGLLPQESQLALWVDRHFGLEERFSSVLYLHQQAPDHPFLPQLERELSERLPKEPDLPPPPSPVSLKTAGAWTIALALPVLLFVLPPGPFARQIQQEPPLSSQEKDALKEAAEKAAKAIDARKTQDQKSREAQKLAKVRQELKALQKAVESGQISREEAISAMKKAQEAIRETRNHLDKDSFASRRLRENLDKALNRKNLNKEERAKALDQALQEFQQRQNQHKNSIPPVSKDSRKAFTKEQSDALKEGLDLKDAPKNQEDLAKQLRDKARQNQQDRQMAGALDQAEQALDSWRPDGKPGETPSQDKGRQQIAGNQQNGQQGNQGGQQGNGQKNGQQQNNGAGQPGGGQKQQGGQGQQGGGQQGQSGQQGGSQRQGGQGKQTAGGQGQSGQQGGRQGQGQQGGGQQSGGNQGGQKGQGQQQAGGQQGQNGRQGQGQGQQAGGQSGGNGQQTGGGGQSKGGVARASSGKASDAGSGTTNKAQRGNKVSGSRPKPGRQLDGMEPRWKEAYVRLYKSVKVDASGTATKVGGQKGTGKLKGQTPTSAPIHNEQWQVESGDTRIAPGRNVEEALDQIEVPPGLEDTVRSYFDAISGE